MDRPAREIVELTFGTFATPIGVLNVFSQGGAVHAVEFADQGRAAAILLRHMPSATIVLGPIPEAVRDAFHDYFDRGRCNAFDGLELRPAGTEFQQAVWRKLREIPPGSTVSYGQLARSIGKANACRAVGAANGSNPIPIIIPCHRVIGENGCLTGYGSGVERKLWLLRHEGVLIDQRAVPRVRSMNTSELPWAKPSFR